MAKRKSAPRGRRRLSGEDVRGQHAAELPKREAMSLILPSTGGLPLLGGDPTAPVGDATAPATGATDAGTAYTGGAQQTALDQTATAQQLASGGGENVPNGTASSTASS